MANLTIAIDDQLLRAARIKAVAEGTSVNEIARKAIEGYAAGHPSDDSDELLSQLRAIARKVKTSPTGEPIWPGREALYEDVMRERGLVKEQAPSKRRR